MNRPDQTPTNIKAPHGASQTEVHWADGHICVYPNEILRGFCPCAHCQGHGGSIEFVPGGNSVIRDLQPMGNYAIKLTWGDGHDTGIYSFRYLRELCERDDVQTRTAGGAESSAAESSAAESSAAGSPGTSTP